jgi:Glycosyltransferases involved in cell wall biogenesis
MRNLVFIPMYNCAAQIPRVLAQFDDPSVMPWVDTVLCVDNRSTDGTLDAARSALEHCPVPTRVLLRNDDNYGLGGSHKSPSNSPGLMATTC